MSAKRNLTLITPYQICSLEGVTHGLYLLWLTAHQGFSPFAAAAAIATSDLALLLFEVPTGVFADRLGPRRSLVLGSVFQVVGIALFWRARALPTLIAGALSIALGDAFRHGADEALLHRSCAAIGAPQSFTTRLAAVEGAALAATVGLTALGGFLAERVSFHAAWALDVGLSLTGLGLACAMTDLPVSPGEPEESDDEGSVRALLASLGPRVPWRIIVPPTIMLTLGSMGEMLTQTTRHEGRGAQSIALVIAGAMALEAVGATLVAKGKVPIRIQTLDALVITALASVVVAALVPHGAVPALLVIFLASGMARPIRSGLVQAGARDEERATVASVSGLTDMMGSMVGLPLAAWLSARAPLSVTALTLGAVALLAWALSARLRAPR